MSTCLALIALLAAGCGGDDDSGGGDSGGGDKPAADSKEQTTKATPAAGGAPSYEDVKKLALADPQTKKACASGSRDIDVPPAEGGETYKRLLCGDRIAFDYVLGAGSTAPTTTTPAGRPWPPIWHLPGKAFVSFDTGQDKRALADGVKQACACGEVSSR